jgi:hypothetical protein
LARDELADTGHVTDLFQHLQAGFVRAAVGRAPQAGDTGGDTGERVGTGRAGQAHGGGRGVLLVVGVQREDASSARTSTGFGTYFSHGLPNIMRMKLAV